MPHSPAISPRKAPKQQRSRATVDAILEATAQVLVEHGYEKSSTNLIARRAGVSIGSLYQYFPNKEALVLALAEKHVADMMAELMAKLGAAQGLPLRPALRVMIDGLMAHHADKPRVHQVLIEEIPRIAGLERMLEMDRMMVDMIAVALTHREERLRPQNVELAAFTLVHAVQGVMHAAVLERPELLTGEDLTAEITDLIARYLLED